MKQSSAARALSRRRFLQVSGSGLAGIVLAACTAPTAPSGADGAAEPGAEATTISVLNANWGEFYNNLMQNIGESYMENNPNVQIDWTFEEQWETKLLTQVAGGTAPDATYTNWRSQANLAAKNTFTPLDSYLEPTGLGREDFVVSMYDACLWDGTLYAVPGGADYLVLFWNKDVYRDVGLDPEQPPTTADELIAHSETILQKDDSGNITRVGYIPSADQYIQWVYLNEGRFYDPENNQITANEPINVETLQWLVDYVNTIDVDKLAAFNESAPSYSQPGNPFATRQSAYLVTGFWAYDALNEFAPDIDYGVAFMPTPTGAEEERENYLIQGWMYAIPAGAKEPDTSWAFIKYAFIDEAATMGVSTLNGPCVKQAFAAFEEGLRELMGSDDRMAPYLDVFTRTGEVGTQHWPSIAVNSYYHDEVVRIWDFASRNDMTPQEALDQVTRNVQNELDKATA